METAKLKKFAQYARRSLIEQVSAKLKLVLTEDSAARRESGQAIKKLESAIHDDGKDQVIERVAYIWFNRFCALRFMDVNRYTRIGVVSPAEGQFQPEILAEAKMGHIDEEMVHDKIRQQIFALLDGKAPSHDPQGEAYRLLVVAACNFWNKAMPFLFERIEDYTELLMPDDLLSGNSILSLTREAMTPDVCEDVEVIGWLYQFYISEKKDEVFEGLKKNKKITPENIPAATQLFTPHWIVRYLVENSLGRLWMQNRPNSKLKERMEYYIEPQIHTDEHRLEDNEKNICVNLCESVVQIASPEEIKICDPACGSGHMLTYAFDLLYAIYEEEGYEPAEIPEKILTHNLYGIEIDERAGELAAFALTMKARAKQRRFFNKGVKPNICVLENVHFDEDELKEYMDFVGRDLFTLGLENTLSQFEEADNFGSLIRPEVTDVDGMLQVLESKNVSGHLFVSLTHQKVVQALRQAGYLSPKYHVVIANPPYMNATGANPALKSLLNNRYKNYKSDLFSAFVERCLSLVLRQGICGLMTPFVWMFISTHEKLRELLYKDNTVLGLVRPSYTAFFQSAIVPICAFLVSRNVSPSLKAHYFDLGYLGNAQEQPKRFSFAKNGKLENGSFFRSATEIGSIPGSPVAYWVGEGTISAFSIHHDVKDRFPVKSGIMTGNDDAFLRLWFEVGLCNIGFGLKDSTEMKHKFFPLSKGGEFRKWYGNLLHAVNLSNDAEAIKTSGSNYRLRDSALYFQPYVTWSRITSSNIGFRFKDGGVLFSDAAPGIFAKDQSVKVIGVANSKAAKHFLNALNPTLNFQTSDIERIPFIDAPCDKAVEQLVSISRFDWDSYETSWDFTNLPLLNPDYRQPTLKDTYQKLRAHWREMTLEMQRLEEENNRIFIDAYGLQDELTPDVPLNEITLTCNPYYRYNKKQTTENIQTTEHTEYTESEKHKDKYSVSSVVKKSFPIDDELEALLLADTMRELVSYAVGCMFGRYALDKPGLILANQGETIEDYYKKLQEPRIDTNGHEGKDKGNISVNSCSLVVQNAFPADEDNVIPMLDGDWFTDDISERFKQFLKVAFGSDHYEENLRFVENALGKDIRKYFLKDFYSDHIKRYKKRPIYWLFSSPKASFNALIYMHRYRPDTVSVVLNDYLREFRTKLTAHKNHLEAVSISASAAPVEKTKALKEIEKITKMIAELAAYEREVLYPLATQQIDIDLDDGVKANYPKFGAALKKIPGLDAKED